MDITGLFLGWSHITGDCLIPCEELERSLAIAGLEKTCPARRHANDALRRACAAIAGKKVVEGDRAGKLIFKTPAKREDKAELLMHVHWQASGSTEVSYDPVARIRQNGELRVEREWAIPTDAGSLLDSLEEEVRMASEFFDSRQIRDCVEAIIEGRKAMKVGTKGGVFLCRTEDAQFYAQILNPILSEVGGGENARASITCVELQGAPVEVIRTMPVIRDVEQTLEATLCSIQEIILGAAMTGEDVEKARLTQMLRDLRGLAAGMVAFRDVGIGRPSDVREVRRQVEDLLAEANARPRKARSIRVVGDNG